MTRPLTQDDLLDVVEREGTRAAAAADGADPDRPVPGCPGLTVGETARHLGSVYRMVVTWIRTGVRPAIWQREPHDGETVANYLRDGLRALLGELAAHPPQTPCETWHPTDRTYAFWRRRMAHESTIHRTDIEAAQSRDLTPIPAEVALDGIDEVLTLWFTHRLAEQGVAATRPATVAIRSTHRTWLSTMHPTGTSTTEAPETTPANAQITGDPMNLYLWLWGRRAVYDRSVTQSGDFDAIAQFWALLRLATK
ncbi:maleylpyruvate isomerase family mycothiol-dependent enzyme [Actinokineospora sp. NPDC004072]